MPRCAMLASSRSDLVDLVCLVVRLAPLPEVSDRHGRPIPIAGRDHARQPIRQPRRIGSVRGEIGFRLFADLARPCIGIDCQRVVRWTAKHAVMGRCALNAAILGLLAIVYVPIGPVLPRYGRRTRLCMLQRIGILERGYGLRHLAAVPICLRSLAELASRGELTRFAGIGLFHYLRALHGGPRLTDPRLQVRRRAVRIAVGWPGAAADPGNVAAIGLAVAQRMDVYGRSGGLCARGVSLFLLDCCELASHAFGFGRKFQACADARRTAWRDAVGRERRDRREFVSRVLALT